MADGLQTGTEASDFLGLQPADLPCRFGLVSLHNHVSQFPFLFKKEVLGKPKHRRDKNKKTRRTRETRTRETSRLTIF